MPEHTSDPLMALSAKVREVEDSFHDGAPVGSTAPKLFLSHNWRDKPFVKRLARDLTIRGAKVWLDTVKIRVGESIISKISDGVQECEFLIVVLSANSVQSNWVKTELRLVMTQELTLGKTKVIPLLYQDCEVPPFLVDKRYADFREDEKYDEALSEILIAVGLTTGPNDDDAVVSEHESPKLGDDNATASDYESLAVGFLLYCMHYLLLAAIPIGYFSGKVVPGVGFNYVFGVMGWLLGIAALGYGFSRYKFVFPIIALLGPTFVPIIFFEARSGNAAGLSVAAIVVGYLIGCLWLAVAFMASLLMRDQFVRKSSLAYKIYARANGL